MKPCTSAEQCHREAVLTARIPNIGDRAMCQSCFDGYVAMGMDIRALEPNAYVPEWRQRSLAKDFGRSVA
jgi:ornithine carbamoyltransferase